jgi:hypothetical protein
VFNGVAVGFELEVLNDCNPLQLDEKRNMKSMESPPNRNNFLNCLLEILISFDLCREFREGDCMFESFRRKDLSDSSFIAFRKFVKFNIAEHFKFGLD